MTRETRKIDRLDHVEVRQEGADVRISGYAAVFYDGTPETEFRVGDLFIERIGRHAFDRLADGSPDVVALFNHDDSQILGRTPDTLQLSVTRRGLRYETRSDPNIPPADRVSGYIRRGDVRGSSFQFIVRGEDWQRTEEGPEIRTITDVELIDVGPVTTPAYEATTAKIRQLRSAAEAFYLRHGAEDRARRVRQIGTELANVNLDATELRGMLRADQRSH